MEKLQARRRQSPCQDEGGEGDKVRGNFPQPEQGAALDAGSAPAPHRAEGPRGCPAILWLSPAAPSRRHGINEGTCTHTGVDEGRSFSLLSAGSPHPPGTASLLFCLGLASGMGGVWAEGRGIPSCHVGGHLKAQ